MTLGGVRQDARKRLIERIGALLQTEPQGMPLAPLAALRAQAVAHQSRAVIADAFGRFDHAQRRSLTHAETAVEDAIDRCRTHAGGFRH